ncbi:MAG: hypothetical protein ACRYFZ_26890 [Janthinobacterium lividum]
MKDRISVWLIVVLLVGFPTVAHALDIGGIFTDFFKVIGAFFKLIFGLILAIGIIYLLVKKK